MLLPFFLFTEIVFVVKIGEEDDKGWTIAEDNDIHEVREVTLSEQVIRCVCRHNDKLNLQNDRSKGKEQQLQICSNFVLH